LPITVFPIPSRGALMDDFHPTPRIFVAQHGSGRRWYTRAGQTHELRTAPRMFDIYEAGLAFDQTQWDGEAGRCVLVEFADADVQAITHGDLQTLKLQTQQEVFDDRVSRITLQLAEAALFGRPQGQLYVQGLCVALLGLLSLERTTKTSSDPAARPLSVAQQRRVTELVGSSYPSDLSLSRLAAEVNLSPQHFTRRFKASYGKTPHAYVQQVRLDAAVRMLRTGDVQSVASVALACGFSSHSHMGDLLRRHMGMRPSDLLPDER